MEAKITMHSFIALLKPIISEFRSRATISWSKRRLRIVFEKISGYDFSSTISQKKLGFLPNEINLCSPSDERILREIFKNINIKNSDRILDIGCGKGFALNYFLTLPFSKVSGLEISELLASICKHNLNRKWGQKAEVILSDATQYDGYSKFNYFYLYNQFPSSEILEKVIEKIVSQSTKEIFVIYNNALNTEVLFEKGFIIKKRILDPTSTGKDILIFSKY